MPLIATNCHRLVQRCASLCPGAVDRKDWTLRRALHAQLLAVLVGAVVSTRMRRSIALPATRRAPTSGGARLVRHTPVWPSAVRELRNRESSAYACMRDLWACVWSDSERAACTCVPCGRAVRAGSAGASQSVSFVAVPPRSPQRGVPRRRVAHIRSALWPCVRPCVSAVRSYRPVRSSGPGGGTWCTSNEVASHDARVSRRQSDTVAYGSQVSGL